MESSYKETLNLPQTDFPMKANLVQREMERVRQWNHEQIYQKIQTQNSYKPLFLLHDGPPYANGHLHIGHAVNKVLKDIVIKYKSKTGFYAPFIPGWDCHGLPIEIQAQKKLKQPYKKNELRDVCKNHAEEYIRIQEEEFKQLLVFGDFDHRYATLDYEYESRIVGFLKYAFQHDYVYRGLRPVHWCIHCATALADAEIEYAMHISPSVYMGFPVKDHQDLFFLVWTTTPWTLPSNVALALNSEIQYGIFSTQMGKRYIIAKLLVEKIVQETNILLSFEEDVLVSELLNRVAMHPFLPQESRIVLGDHVTLDMGSGVVHIAPGHGVEDFELANKYALPVVMPINAYGKYVDTPLVKNLDFLIGKTIWQGNDIILECLKNLGTLFYTHEWEHSYPHCWRCKNPIITRATNQWFIGASKMISDMCKEVTSHIQFFPTDRKERFLNIIQNRPDWCISRQRTWGVPIPSIICECGEELLDENMMTLVEERIKKEGANFWFDPTLVVADIDPNITEKVCSVCHKKGQYTKAQDILDVWLDSSVSWMDLLEHQLKLDPDTKIDLYLEGNDQFRAWYQVSLITGMIRKNTSPYKSILTHGMVLDEQGKAMSKSVGNVFSAVEVCQKYGADILRLWVVSQSYTEDMRFGSNIINQISDMYRKIRNTFRFLLGNLFDYSQTEFRTMDVSELQELDQWVLWKLHLLEISVRQSYETYHFDTILRQVFQFMNEDLSSFYLDVLKDPLYTLKATDPIRRSAQYSMTMILQVLVDLLSPILSFTMEEVYEYLPFTIEEKEESIFLKDMFQTSVKDSFEDSFKKIEYILEIRKKVHKELESLRNQKIIGSNLEARVILYTADKVLLETPNLDFYLIVAECQVVPSESDLKIEVKKGSLFKCPRCYRYISPAENTLCARCQEVLS